MPSGRWRRDRPPQRHLRPRDAPAAPASPAPGFVHAPAGGPGPPRLIAAAPPRGALTAHVASSVVVLVEPDVAEVDAAAVLLGRAEPPPDSSATGCLGDGEELFKF